MNGNTPPYTETAMKIAEAAANHLAQFAMTCHVLGAVTIAAGEREPGDGEDGATCWIAAFLAAHADQEEDQALSSYANIIQNMDGLGYILAGVHYLLSASVDDIIMNGGNEDEST